MTDFPLQITAWSSLILGTLLLVMAFRVSSDRRSKGILLGDQGDKIILKKIRGHCNAVEQIPMALILLGFVEYLQGSTYALIIAAILIAGRLMHATYFSFDGTNWRFRFYGMLLTYVAYLFALLALLRALVF
ncbi:MAG: MAPEG family protein [Amylibacter sp.]|nr:MAPEG family protein [Amylibacter sp.]